MNLALHLLICGPIVDVEFSLKPELKYILMHEYWQYIPSDSPPTYLECWLRHRVLILTFLSERDLPPANSNVILYYEYPQLIVLSSTRNFKIYYNHGIIKIFMDLQQIAICM
jgi:hypothetical protein